MTRTVVHLMRHGEVHNPTGVLYGRMPGFGLSDAGRRQASIVAEYLRDHDVTHVISSPLQRAQETAAEIARPHGLNVLSDDQLIEAHNNFQGMRVAPGDGVLRHPEHWPMLRNPFLPSWGEPYLQIAHRMLAALQRARALASGHEVVCVSHQLPIWTLRRYLEGRRLWHDPRRRQCSLASLTSVVFTEERVLEIVYAEPIGATDPRVTGA
jgi:broad specificity phosphatase PhoE